MLVRLRAILESLRENLFFLPSVFVVLAVVLGQGMLELDARTSLASVPTYLRFTVDSARELLSTVAGATVTVTGIVFALTALSVQLASSQFSPRVVRGFLRDRFTQTSIGFMAGTFTYSLVVLRAVRNADGPETANVVPNLSAGLALVLAVGVVIVILAYVNHIAQSLQATQLIGKVTEGTVALIGNCLPEAGPSDPDGSPETEPPAGPGRRLSAPRSGWVQQIRDRAILCALPEGGVVRIDVRTGAFVHRGQRLCTVWTTGPAEPDVDEDVLEGIALGRVRTMQQDPSFGIRQLVDIALRALSPGVNDVTTAYECIVHLREILYEILRRGLPPPTVVHEGHRRLLRPHEPSHAEFVERALDQIRMNSADMPDVCVALLDTLAGLARELVDLGFDQRVQPLRRQARLVLAGAEASSALPSDVERVHAAAAPLLVGSTAANASGPFRD